MCEPTTMLMLASTAMGVVGTVQQSQAASANAKFQQQVANDNAARTTNQMRDAAERGSDEEQRVKMEGARVVANTRGALATNNMDLTFGSPLDTIIQTSMTVEQDAYRVRRNTEAEVSDLETQKYNYLNQGAAYGAEAKNAKKAGFIAGVGTALSGGAEASKYSASIK